MQEINIDNAAAAGLRDEFVLAFTILHRIDWIASAMQRVAALELYEELVASLRREYKFNAVYERLRNLVRAHQDTGETADQEAIDRIRKDLADVGDTVVAEQSEWI